jgi:hypothetical protein
MPEVTLTSIGMDCCAIGFLFGPMKRSAIASLLKVFAVPLANDAVPADHTIAFSRAAPRV